MGLPPAPLGNAIRGTFSYAVLAFSALVLLFLMACATRRPGRSPLGGVVAFRLLTTALLVALYLALNGWDW